MPDPTTAEDPNPSDASSNALAPLRIPIFRAIWIASLGSNFGGLIQSVGAAWLMTSISTPQMTALVQTSVTLPIMLLSLLAGAMADVFDRRRIMLAAQLFMLTVSVTLSVAAWQGWITPWTLLAFTFLIGCGTAFNNPAWQASVGDMVPRRDLIAAVTLNSMGFNLARSAGPAIGGAIVAAAGAAAAFAVNAVSYLALILVIFRWKPVRQQQQVAREGLMHAVEGGVRYAAMSPRLHAVLLRAFLFGVGASAVPALMPLVARHTVAGGPLLFGVLLGAFGVGAVGGALISGRLRQRLTSESLIRRTAPAFALAAVVVGFSPSLMLTLPALVVCGLAWILSLSTFNVTVQMSVPRWVVARMLAVYQMTTFGGMAAGAWIWGALAQGAGIEVAHALSAAVLLVCTLVGLRWPLPRVDDLNLDPIMRWREPQTDVPILPRSGPVVISVEFRIRNEDVPEFLETMTEPRRIRRRDGALGWTLSRDLADHEVWIERYAFPTWADYVRSNLRFTYDDAEASDHIRDLHVGPERPIVRRVIERSADPVEQSGRLLAEPLTDATRAS